MRSESLTHVRHALLALHKALVDRERGEYEKVHGPTSPGEMLQLLINGEQFSWLRPVSELIVRIDELIGNANEHRRTSVARPAMTSEQVKVETQALLSETRVLLESDDAPISFRTRYLDVLHVDPAIVVIHQAVMRTLGRQAD